MLILLTIFICLEIISNFNCVSISQSINVKNKSNYFNTHETYCFLKNFNFLKPKIINKIRNEKNHEYDEAQITKTINLPKNTWPSIANTDKAGIERQERVQKFWEKENVYYKLCKNRIIKNVKKKTFECLSNLVKIIVDGPPYANGVPHLGHFLNKTIKDVLIRFLLLQGDVPMMIPGWDCHGMPIEHKVLKMYNGEDNPEKINRDLIKYLIDREKEEYPSAKEYGEVEESKEDNKSDDSNNGDKKTKELDYDAILDPEDMPMSEKKLWSWFIRDKCTEVAYRSIRVQMAYFKNSGIWGFWDYYYATYHSNYEEFVMKEFMRLVDAGKIYKAKLPQIFSPKSKSVLADSELVQRTEQVLTSYITFPVDLNSCNKGKLKKLKDKMDKFGLKNLKLVAWTSTCYTIPGNKGLSVEPRGVYHLYKKGDCLYIMNDLVLKSPNDEFWSQFQHIKHLDMLDPGGYREDGSQNEPFSLTVLPEKEPNEFLIEGYEMAGIEYFDPVYKNKYTVYHENFVDSKKATGIVHLSPAHGFDDFNTINKDSRFVGTTTNNDFNYCNLFDEDENFYPHIHYALGQMNIRDFDVRILSELVGENLLKYEKRDMEVDIDWRSENLVHTRLTNQYCLAMPEKEDIVDMAKKIKITPESGRRYLNNIIRSRNRDWCLSRQKYWGIPIPYSGKEELALYTSPPKDLTLRVWRKSKDIPNIVDIWFESATANLETVRKATHIIEKMVKIERFYPLPPIDKYLQKTEKYAIEGQDQHRGWFQSMIIVNMLRHGPRPPVDKLFAHLFVNLKDQKLSKSKMKPQKLYNDSVLFGTRELQLVNKDIDISAYPENVPKSGDNKAQGDVEKIEHLLRPGYDIVNLLNPEPSSNSSEIKGQEESPSGESFSEGNEMYFNLDLLRTFVCNNDFFTHDLELSTESITSASQTHKKVVNFFKYLVGILSKDERKPQTLERKEPKLASYNWGKINVPEIPSARFKRYKLSGIDLYFLNQAYSLAENCKELYQNCQFFKVLGLVDIFITSVSSIYFSYIKNFIYVLDWNSEENKAIRFVLNKLFYITLKVLGPIMPHLCEDLYQSLNSKGATLFSRSWPVRNSSLPNVSEDVGLALTVRKMINKSNAHSNNCILKLEGNEITDRLKRLQALNVDLSLVFNVAGVEFVDKLQDFNGDGVLKYNLSDSDYKKCKRCWIHKEDVRENDLCKNCQVFLDKFYGNFKESEVNVTVT